MHETIQQHRGIENTAVLRKLSDAL